LHKAAGLRPDRFRTPRFEVLGLAMIIAAVAAANDCVLVTDNDKDFAGLQIFNPIRETV